MKLLYFIFIVALLGACAKLEVSQQTHDDSNKSIKSNTINIEKNPQSANFYTKDINHTKLTNQDFFHYYFKPWNIDAVSIGLKEAMWAHNVFKYGNSYGENLQLIKQVFFDKMLYNANFEEYATFNKKAVTTELLSLRAFPTDRPVLRDPQKAGEGFPFDYMQNSTIAPNKPIIVSHYSRDKEWVFVQASFAFGWVQAKDIAFIPQKHIHEWKKAEQIVLTKDGMSLYSSKGDFLFKSRIGMLLALIGEDSKNYTVLTISRTKNGYAHYESSQISKQHSHKGALNFNAKNIRAIIDELLESNYGWGGMYGQRDCSSTMRDFYTPFGLWLPRNSLVQAEQGTKILLENMSDRKKIDTIKKQGIPFKTLLYKPGHIVLYVGTFENEIIVFQNVWGVATKEDDNKEGRYIIGKTIFSGLEVGKDLHNYDADSSLLRNLKSMSFPAKEN